MGLEHPHSALVMVSSPFSLARYLRITKSHQLHLQSSRSCNSEIGARATIKSRVALLSAAHKQKTKERMEAPDQSGITAAAPAALPVPASAPLSIQPSVVQAPALIAGVLGLGLITYP